MKNIYLKIFNYILYLSTCALIGVGFLLKYRLKSGGEAHGVLIMGMSRHDWALMHFYCAVIFVVAALAHLLLNWSWIVKVASSKKPILLIISVGIGLVLLVLPLLYPSEISQTQFRRGQSEE